MNAREQLLLEPSAHGDGLSVPAGRAGQRDGFKDDVIRGEPEMGKPLGVELLEDLAHPFVIRVILRGEGMEEPGIDEDHFL